MAKFTITDTDVAAIMRSLVSQQQAVEASLKRLEEINQEAYTHRSRHGESQAAPLVVAIDLRGFSGRVTVEVWVQSSGAADFFIEGSADGKNFRHLYTLSVGPGGGDNHDGYMNAYPVLRVSTEAANDNEIEIVAAR